MKFSYTLSQAAQLLFLLRSGDIELNPGPSQAEQVVTACDAGEFVERNSWETSREELKERFEAYANTTMQPFVLRSATATQLVYTCRHGIKRETKSTGARASHSNVFTGCPAKVSLGFSKVTGRWKVASCCFTHIGHPIDEETFKSYQCKISDQQASNLRREFKQMGVKIRAKTAVKHIRQKFGISVSPRDIYNRKLLKHDEILTDLQGFLDGIKNSGGVLEEMLLNNAISAVFLVSETMKNRMDVHKPSSIMIETSAIANDYQVLLFCFNNSETGKMSVAAMAFLEIDHDDLFTAALMSFKKLLTPSVCVAGGSFRRLEQCQTAFGCPAFFSRWHVARYFKSLIATAATSLEVKMEIFENFLAMMNSHSDQEYQDFYDKFDEQAENVCVKFNQQYLPLKAFFDTSWHTCQDLWVAHHRGELEMEKTFPNFKVQIESVLSEKPEIFQGLPALVDMAYENEPTTAMLVNQEYTKDLYRASFGLTSQGVQFFFGQLQLMACTKFTEIHPDRVLVEIADGIRKFSTSTTDCDCSTFKSTKSPCSHILALRRQENMPLFDLQLYADQYHRSNEYPDVISSESEGEQFFDFESANFSCQPEVSCNQSNYEEAMHVFGQFARIISQHGDKQFRHYMDAIMSVRNCAQTANDFTGTNPVVDDDSASPLKRPRCGDDA